MIASKAEYRRWTGDSDSFDADIDSALADAQSLIETYNHRHYESAQRTETLEVNSYGSVYPTATPIASVVGHASSVIHGSAVRVSSSDYVSEPINSATITYTGGYSPEAMPVELKMLVARIAHNILHPSNTTNIPAGVTSMKVGDVSYSGHFSKFAILADISTTEIRRWRHGGDSLGAPAHVGLYGEWRP